ncbi:MAG: helix-turn-helix domain-containing protein [Limisphaerales bacterium]
MSFLGTALQRICDERGITHTEIARQSGVSRSFISRVLSGESQDFSNQHFVAILKVFAADPTSQAEIIAARCTDAWHPAEAANIPGANLVEIKIHGTAEEPGKVGRHDGGRYASIHLTKEVEDAIDWLRSQCPVNPELQRHLVGYARLLRGT